MILMQAKKVLLFVRLTFNLRVITFQRNFELLGVRAGDQTPQAAAVFANG